MIHAVRRLRSSLTEFSLSARRPKRFSHLRKTLLLKDFLGKKSSGVNASPFSGSGSSAAFLRMQKMYADADKTELGLVCVSKLYNPLNRSICFRLTIKLDNVSL